MGKDEKAKSKRRQRRRYHLAVKNLSALLRRITSKHQKDFYCLDCLHSFAKDKKLESHKKVRKNRFLQCNCAF